MTGTVLDYDPNDTGDIPPCEGLGDEPTRNLRAERDAILAATGRLRHLDAIPDSLVTGHGYDPEAHPGPIVDMVDTVTFGITGDLAGPQSPPPPLPKPPPTKDDPAETGGNLFGGLGEHLPEVPLRRSVPYVMPDDRKPWTGARHAAPAPAWTKWAIGVGLLLAVCSFVVLAVFL